jgi:hypothetical protein
MSQPVDTLDANLVRIFGINEVVGYVFFRSSRYDLDIPLAASLFSLKSCESQRFTISFSSSFLGIRPLTTSEFIDKRLPHELCADLCSYNQLIT